MKFKLTSGDSSFSFEGELEEAKILLDAYWNPVGRNDETEGSNGSSTSTKAPSKQRRKRARAAPSGAAATSSAAVSIDPQSLANTIKTSEHFEQIKTKILEKKGDWVSKCKMVAYFANEPITSGDVKRTMDAFKVKSRLPNLSTTLSKNSDQFLTNGENPVKYELTNVAESNFLSWLTSTTDE